MNAQVFQDKISKLSRTADWEFEDTLDFMANFIHGHGLADEFLEAMADEITELNELADEVDGILDGDEEEPEGEIEEGD